MAIPLSLSNVPDETPYIQYVASNGQTVYPYPFPITQDSDLVVVINGVTQNTDSTYSLSGQGNDTGGNVTLNSGSTAGDVVTLYRDIAIERLTQFAQNGGFSSSAFNAEFNNLYLIAQQLEASNEQSLRIPNTNNPAPVTVLTPGAYANKYLAFDAYGNPTPAALTSSGSLTASILGGLIYPSTSAERSTGVALNLVYRYGSFQRYGMDPSGTNDSSGQLAAAAACNNYIFDEFPGGGKYIFNSTVAVTNYPLRVQGSGKNAAGPSAGISGTRFILQSGAGSNAALLHWTAFASDVEIDHICFGWQSVTSGQIAILFDVDCRSTRIHNNTFFGGVATSNNVTGIKLAGGGTFSGDVTIRENYGTAIQTGIYLGATCSTVRVIDNELYSNVGFSGSIGLNNQSIVGGVIAEGNTFEQWDKGIYSPGGKIRQIDNYFEGSLTYDFDWATSLDNLSSSDISTGTPAPNFVINNSSGNVVLGGSFGSVIDSTTIQAYRGFIEQGRAVASGHWTTIAYASGNFAGPWAPTSGQVTLEQYTLLGNTCILDLTVSGATISGTNPAVAYTMPVTSSQTIILPVWITTGANVSQFGVAILTANSATLRIYVDATLATNWPNGSSGAVNVGISFQINTSIP